MSTLPAFATTVVVAVAIGCAGRSPAPAPAQPAPAATTTQAAPALGPFVSPAEAHRLVEHEGALLLDVRTKDEYAAGHVPGALNIPVEELAGRSGELPAPPKKVVVYCHTGRRASRAAGILGEKGYDVANLGPMSAWDAK